MHSTMRDTMPDVDAEQSVMTGCPDSADDQCATWHNHLNDLDNGAVEVVDADAEREPVVPIICRRCRYCRVIRAESSFLHSETICLRCRHWRTRCLCERWHRAARARSLLPYMRRKTKCGRCGEYGHNIQSCESRSESSLSSSPEFSSTGYVYFIEAKGTGFIKIGWAAHVGRRLASLQTANPSRLVLLGWMHGTRGTELRIHRQFAASRVRPNGEWFSPTPELAHLIKSTQVGT